MWSNMVFDTAVKDGLDIRRSDLFAAAQLQD
jgi:hypothetical protein